MPVFTYRGTNRAGATVTGEQLAPNKNELVNMLRKQQIKTLGRIVKERLHPHPLRV